ETPPTVAVARGQDAEHFELADQMLDPHPLATLLFVGLLLRRRERAPRGLALGQPGAMNDRLPPRIPQVRQAGGHLEGRQPHPALLKQRQVRSRRAPLADADCRSDEETARSVGDELRLDAVALLLAAVVMSLVFGDARS